MNNEKVRILRRIGDAINRMADSIHPTEQSENSHQDRSHHKSHPPPNINIESPVRLEPAIHDYYAAEQAERPAKNRREDFRLKLEGATFLAAIVAAIFTGFTYTAIREQTPKIAQSAQAAADAANSSIYANRPWIAPRGLPPHSKRIIQEANLEWYNAGKTPAISVFSTAEFFVGGMPKQVRNCVDMEKELKQKPIGEWQFQSFVAPDGKYEVGLAHTPVWNEQPMPMDIHGCVWYTDLLSNTERSTEFFYTAFYGKFFFPMPTKGIDLFYLSERPFVYK